MAPPTKRRKTEPTVVEEVVFDPTARQEYLTGFHKRKLERAKHAKDLAEKKARAEKIADRKKLREERMADLERHVQEVNALLKTPGEPEASETEGNGSDAEEVWEGVVEVPDIDHEAEYIDEDKYTTVTVETMDISKAGLDRAEQEAHEDGSGADDAVPNHQVDTPGENNPKKRSWTKEKPKSKADKLKKKKKKFRYESKAERKFTRMKEKSKNSKEAKARRAG